MSVIVTKTAPQTEESRKAAVLGLIRQERLSHTLNRFDSLISKDCTISSLYAPKVKDFFAVNGLTYANSSKILLKYLPKCVVPRLPRDEKTEFDEIVKFYGIPPEGVHEAVATAIHKFLGEGDYGFARTLGLQYGFTEESMDRMASAVWRDHRNEGKNVEAAILARESGIAGPNGKSYFEGPAGDAFKKALMRDIAPAIAVGKRIGLDGELRARFAREFLIELLTSDRFYRSYLASPYSKYFEIRRHLESICIEFRVDKRAVGLEAFTHNVADLSFRKAKMTADLTGLTGDEQKQCAIDACERVATSENVPERAKLQAMSIISDRFGLEKLGNALHRNKNFEAPLDSPD